LPEFTERRVYRQKSLRRVLAIVFTAIGLLASLAVWTQTLTGQREATYKDLLVPVALFFIGVLFLYISYTSYVALSPSEVQYRSALRLLTLPLDKIRGRRRYLDDGGAEEASEWRLRIESDDDRYPSLDFQESYYRFDTEFFEWFKSLPDLDELDKLKLKTSNFGLA